MEMVPACRIETSLGSDYTYHHGCYGTYLLGGSGMGAGVNFVDSCACLSGRCDGRDCYGAGAGSGVGDYLSGGAGAADDDVVHDQLLIEVVKSQ